jgi:hypothetical protein
MGEGGGSRVPLHITQARVILGFASMGRHGPFTPTYVVNMVTRCMKALNGTCAIVNGVLGILGVIVAGGNASSSRKKKNAKIGAMTLLCLILLVAGTKQDAP